MTCKAICIRRLRPYSWCFFPVLVLTFLLPNKAGFTQSLPDDVPERIIRVTGDRDYPPYCFLDNGIPTGFDIDIIRAVAHALNINVEIELKPWSEARHRLETGRADIIAGMARIPIRENEHSFSVPIKQLTFDMFVPDKSNIQTLEDARHAAILVQKAGVMYDLIKSEGILTNIIPVADAPEAMRLLATGNYDGAIVNLVQGYYVMDKMGLPGIRRLKASLPTIPYCIAARHGENDLIDLLNDGLQIIKAEGIYREIYNKWFGVYEAQSEGEIFRIAMLSISVIAFLLILIALIHRSLRRTIQRHTAELRSIIDLIPHPIYARDRNGRYVMANQSMATLMGLEIDQIIGQRYTDIHPATNHHTDYLKEDQDVFESHTFKIIPETEYIDMLGRKRYMQVSKIPFHIQNGKVKSVLCVAVDITDLKDAEKTAQLSRENLAITLNSIRDGVISTDAAGLVTRINPVVETFTGIAAADAIGRHISAVLSIMDLDGGKPAIDDIVKQGGAKSEKSGLSSPLILVHTNGSERDVSLVRSPIIDSAGTTTGMVYVLRDVTEENRLHRQLTETQKMESVGRLAGGVAHDFNNLLTGIIGYTELLNISLSEHDECRTYLKGILEASERARDLVQQLLTFSRKHPREVGPVNVHTVIGHVISLLQHTMDRRITISRHLNATGTDVMGDRSQLQNALLNLGVNARDAMPAGGSITVATRDVRISAADCENSPFPIKPGDFVEITITDTGVGMDRETIRHIFEPFYTTKGKLGGTGLGLSAVYGTVNDHGGYIDVVSKPGHGTTFTIGLPVELTKLVKTEDDEVEMTDPRGNGTILVVDDEAIVSKILCDLLGSLGYNTLTAVNGRDALSVYKSNRDKIDLVILDMIMPELNGEETFRELKRLNPQIKVMMCSGFLQDFRVDELLKLGILDFLHKPFRKSELASIVSSILKKSSDNR